MSEKDCFAYQRGACSVLTLRKCLGRGCRFYKTAEQLKEEQDDAMKRILSLDPLHQQEIYDKYYRQSGR
ncbi:MAG: hypothetical protein SCK57_09265 [Bacillota bacterium]|nr:hypothetical protein [Bacillota bacterium]MDW7677837.1 hypothetical protein [Bacillota bacterium]